MEIMSGKMTNCMVTIVFLPRERFSLTAKSLESILAHTSCQYEFICIDGNAPEAVANYLKEKCREHGFTLLRSNEYITPNEARNAALKYVKTPYVVFIDNDVLVADGWLEGLINCAEETGAWLVGPLYLEEKAGSKRLHMFGGDISLIHTPAGRDFLERHNLSHRGIDEVANQLVRRATGLLEFHTLLARREVFDKLGPLDPGLMSFAEHADLCYAVAVAGGKIFLEPTSVITHILPQINEMDADDLAYFRLRWSEAWASESKRNLCDKYRVSPSSARMVLQRSWCVRHRLKVTAAFPKTRRILGRRLFKLIRRFFLAPLELRRNQMDFTHEECVLKRKPTIERVETE